MSVVDFSSVDMSAPLLTDFSSGKTGVFWDVNDFPVPEGRGIRDKYWRMNDMLLDIALWAVNNPFPPYRNPANVMVLAINRKEKTDFVGFLGNLSNRVFNVLLVVPEDVEPEQVNIPAVYVAWYWKSIQGDGEPMPGTHFRSLLDRQRAYILSLGEDDDD
ncbi:unnamed protein product [Microthlaspi erraticum]|uniref:NYN domain-containing protein n=1 Tax=Microthlaspi erraticum TaxID=1685480 RepID=A0A6D2KVY8_9BRAS|nr:unnamed protein product [Microthlaspi erraticum]